MKPSSLTCVALYIIIALHGCSTPETHMVDGQLVGSSFPFIRDGKITRSEILDRLGQPASYFENGSIIIYWLFEDKHGLFEVVSKNPATITLQKHSILDILGGSGGSNKGRRIDTRSGYYNLVLVFDNNNILTEHSLVFIR